MNTLNKIKNTSLILAMGALVFTSCDKDDEEEDPTPVATTNTIVTSNITTDITWTKDKVYQLIGRITVTSGHTLTIEKGTIIKGGAGTGANATALLIARGAKLMAEGTADEPIIFTSVLDEISQETVANGNFASPNLNPDLIGLWGGVIVLGKARISAANEVDGQDVDVNELQIEGIPTSDSNGLYGGTDDADNSGILKYISIRHGGTNIGQGNEINGLSLGGVGAGTVIDHIEIVANQDDAIEFFGGTVNVTNLVSWNVGDDGIDTDMSWAGTLDNFVVIAPLGHAFELDGPEGSYDAGHTIRNGSIKMTYEDRTSEDIINVDDNSNVSLENLYFTGIVEGQMINRVTAEEVSFSNITLNVPSADLEDYVNGDVPSGITIGTTPQADISVLSWTWCAQAGAMSGL